MTNILFNIASPVAYFAVFIFLILCGVGNPIPEDTILLAAGYLAYDNVVNLYFIIGVCYLGVLAGDLLLYGVGRKYGQKLINHPKFLKIIPIGRIEKVRRGFLKRGHWMVFFARFLIGFRSPTFLLSGVMRLPLKEFLLIDCLGALISVPVFVGLGYLFGAHVGTLRHDIRRIESWIVAAVIAGVAIYVLWRWLTRKKEDVRLERELLWEPAQNVDKK